MPIGFMQIVTDFMYVKWMHSIPPIFLKLTCPFGHLIDYDLELELSLEVFYNFKIIVTIILQYSLCRNDICVNSYFHSQKCWFLHGKENVCYKINFNKALNAIIKYLILKHF